MLDQVSSSMDRNGLVEVKKFLHFASLNNVMMSVFGKSYEYFDESGGGDGYELEKLVSEGYKLLGIFNWKRCRDLVSRVNVFVDEIIKEHRERRSQNGGAATAEDGDFVDVLLDLESENKFSDADMIADGFAEGGEELGGGGVPTGGERVGTEYGKLETERSRYAEDTRATESHMAHLYLGLIHQLRLLASLHSD
ncbi:hypothetical protein L1887_34879 [Cichorium endivia]|nr:hypothetical protein L1887_34879 [Cichorium endivia]